MRTILTCVVILACAACNQNAPAPASKTDAASESAAIEQLETAQLAAVRARDEARSTSPYADDAVFINERGQASRGKDAIATTFKEFLADPTTKFDYTPGKKVISESGDMAYSTAEFSVTYTDPATKKPVTTKGTNLSVWRKQADGSWKLVADSNPAGPTG